MGKREPKQMLTARRNGKLPSGRVVVACGGRGVMMLTRQYTGKTTAPPRVWKATPQILGLYRRGGLGHCVVRERIEKGEGGENHASDQCLPWRYDSTSMPMYPTITSVNNCTLCAVIMESVSQVIGKKKDTSRTSQSSTYAIPV